MRRNTTVDIYRADSTKPVAVGVPALLTDHHCRVSVDTPVDATSRVVDADGRTYAASGIRRVGSAILLSLIHPYRRQSSGPGARIAEPVSQPRAATRHVPTLNARETARVDIYPPGSAEPAAIGIPAAIAPERGLLVGRVPSGTPIETDGRVVDRSGPRTYTVGLAHRLPGHSDVLVQLTPAEG